MSDGWAREASARGAFICAAFRLLILVGLNNFCFLVALYISLGAIMCLRDWQAACELDDFWLVGLTKVGWRHTFPPLTDRNAFMRSTVDMRYSIAPCFALEFDL